MVINMGRVAEALMITEEELGRPAFAIEVAQTLYKTSYMPSAVNKLTQGTLMTMMVKDKVLVNTQSTMFSLNKKNQSTEDNPTDFELFSDRMHRRFPSYITDCTARRIMPGPDSPRINLNTLKEILLSTDLSRDAELPDTSGKVSQFLDGADISGNHVAFASYPRSGNSFLRGYIQKMTTVHTGSDIYAYHMMNNGLLGELHTPDSNLVWTTKTHFPLIQMY